MYGDYRHLSFCLDSVRCQRMRVDRIIMLDNQGRTDGNGPIGNAYPELRVLAMQDNLGYSGGVNRIIRQEEFVVVSWLLRHGLRKWWSTSVAEESGDLHRLRRRCWLRQRLR